MKSSSLYNYNTIRGMLQEVKSDSLNFDRSLEMQVNERLYRHLRVGLLRHRIGKERIAKCIKAS